jgi:energy-coupling factor transport system ATP-binding protein
MLAEFGLLEHRWANPFSLSQGQKRRLSVATQLITGRRLLVLDEPTFGQDPRTSAALMERIADLRRQGRTIVMVSHDIQLVSTYATLVAVLLDGQVAFTGPPSELMDQPQLLRAASLALAPVWAVARRLSEMQRVRLGDVCTTAAIPN